MDQVLCAMDDRGYTIKQLASMTGRLENSIWKALRALMEEGTVEREKCSAVRTGGRRPYIYKIK